ncbi:MAG: FAD-dependent oxidoreductase [Acidisphaera sp.]|nr:FAD-dependent oxidoreductase [Acidisphaera sp.]
MSYVSGPVHVVGGGLAGLSAALALAEAGRQINLYEAGPSAGGRCRSYFDRGLGCRIDNGNHLLLSGNRAAYAYLDRIGTRHSMGGPGYALFPFHDLESGERWTVRPGAGRYPWWLLDRGRRVPGTRLRDYLGLLALRRAAAEATVASLFAAGSALYRRLIEPLAIAVLNTLPAEASGRLLAAVLAETLLLGGSACIPAFPRMGLSESFIDPAIAWLRARGGEVQFGRRIAALVMEGERVAALGTADGPVRLGPDEAVVLAVPAWVAVDLLPELDAPDTHESILNVHFRIDAERGQAGFIGLLGGGMAEWIFVKPGVLSVTISAANRFVDRPAEAIAETVWRDVRATCDLPERMPPVRVVKERRATFAATAAQHRRRPPARTRLANLVLAGDWTATGLPATIEGAIRSGQTAASLLLAA